MEINPLHLPHKPVRCSSDKWTCPPSLRTNLDWHPTRPRASEELIFLPCNSICLDFSSATLKRGQTEMDI